MKTKTVEGYYHFHINNKEIEIEVINYKEANEKLGFPAYNAECAIYDLMSGETFIENVKDGLLTDYDGNLADIFIDNHESNLGLYSGNLQQGRFCLGINDFLDLCKKYKVEVNWANK